MHAHCERLDQLLAGMPPVAAMGIRVVEASADHLRLQAPLKANLNDKGNAFGGSLASIMTLSGWGLVTLTLDRAGLDAEVYVADSHVRYLTPLFTDLQAEAQLADGAEWSRFLAQLVDRGHASVQLVAKVVVDGERPAALLEGRYVARMRAAA